MQGNNIYKGFRYVPKNSGDWVKDNSYEALTVVQYQGNSYTSKICVPKGIDILDTRFWTQTANYNQQFENLRDTFNTTTAETIKELNDFKNKQDNEFADLLQSHKDNVNAYVDEMSKELEDERDKIQKGGLNDVISQLNDIVINALHPPIPYPPLIKGENNSDKIQTLCDYLYSIGGGVLYIPEGLYITNSIKIPQNVIIKGSGESITFLKMADNINKDFITFDNSAYGGITDLTIDGNKSHNTLGSGITIKSSVGTDASNLCLKLERIQIAMCAENGINCVGGNSWVFAIRFVHIETCDGYGILNESTDNTFFMIDIYNCKQGALYNSGTNNRFIGGKWYINGDKTDVNHNIVYSKGRRNQYSNIELQESYGNSLVVENASYEQFTNFLIDSTGHYNSNNLVSSVKFINSFKCKFDGIIANGDVTDTEKYCHEGISISDNCRDLILNVLIDKDRIVNPLIINNARNIKITGNINYLPTLKLYNNNSQIFNVNSDNTLILAKGSNAKNIDYNNETGEITIISEGVYNIDFNLEFLQTETSKVSIELYNASNLLSKMYYGSISQYDRVVFSKILNLNNGDRLKINITPIDSNMSINANNSSYVELCKLS